MMAEQFYTILTQIGKAKIAIASALGNKVEFKYMALGDGGGKYYNPTENQTELKNEVWRGQIGNIAVDEENPNWIVIETIILADQGGFMIREAGIFDEEGNLVAVGKYPETYKPIVTNGSSKDLYVRMILEISNTSIVNLKVDPTVILATKKDIDEVRKEVNEKTSSITAENIKLSDGKTIEGKFTEVQGNIGNINDLTLPVELKGKSLTEQTKQLFQSGLDGKNLLETSIKSKGGTVSKQGTVATFNELDLGIKSIETDSTGDATAVAGDILSGKTAYARGVKLIGTIPSKTAATITPSTVNQTISAGQYLEGVQTIKGDSNLISTNIRQGKSIFGINGSVKPLELAPGTYEHALADKSVDMNDTFYRKMAEGTVNMSGIVRISYKLRSLYSDVTDSRARTYVNGVAHGPERSVPSGDWVTYTEDITVNAGDKIQIYAKKVTGARPCVYQVKLMCNFPLPVNPTITMTGY